MGFVSFAAGFITGWLVRSSVESSRELAVDVARRSQTMLDRLRRKLVAEQEFLEDLWAEAHAEAKEPQPEPTSAKGEPRRATVEAVPSPPSVEAPR